MGEKSIAAYEQQVAPFVVKTYQMVNDPRTDSLIRWGKANNSFLVLDPNEFSKFLLPFYFKHSNFSSFVRQLNTYGFKKVDPDRWEFAHQAFLRGQIHLLPRVVRRTRTGGSLNWCATATGSSSSCSSDDKKEAMERDIGDEALLRELGRLRQEQRNLEEELQIMKKRLQASERRPQQIMSFLVRVAKDPDLLPRLVFSKKKQMEGQKRRRLLASSGQRSFPPPPSLPRSPLPPPTPPGPSVPLPQLQTDKGVFYPYYMGSAVDPIEPNPLEVGSHPLIIQEVKPFTLISDDFCAVISNYEAQNSQINDDFSVYEEEGNFVGLNPGNHMSFQPEFGMLSSRLSSSEEAAAAAKFPFSLLGNGFF